MNYFRQYGCKALKRNRRDRKPILVKNYIRPSILENNLPGRFHPLKSYQHRVVTERRITRHAQIDDEKQTEKEAWNTPEQDPSAMASSLRDVTNPCSVASKQVRQDTTKPIVERAIS
jgi:hypothetical protein